MIGGNLKWEGAPIDTAALARAMDSVGVAMNGCNLAMGKASRNVSVNLQKLSEELSCMSAFPDREDKNKPGKSYDQFLPDVAGRRRKRR